MLRNRGLRALIAILDGFRDRGIRTAIGAAALVACGLSPSQANAAQLSPDGIIYDTVNNISWLTDGDLPATNKFGLPVGMQRCDQPENVRPAWRIVLSPAGVRPGHARGRDARHRCRPLQEHTALSLLGLRRSHDSERLSNR